MQKQNDDSENKSNQYVDKMKKMDDEMQRRRTQVFTKSDLPKMTQLEIDAINVFEKRVDMKTFSKEYQQQIKNFYRFSPISVQSLSASASEGNRGFWK